MVRGRCLGACRRLPPRRAHPRRPREDQSPTLLAQERNAAPTRCICPGCTGRLVRGRGMRCLGCFSPSSAPEQWAHSLRKGDQQHLSVAKHPSVAELQSIGCNYTPLVVLRTYPAWAVAVVWSDIKHAQHLHVCGEPGQRFIASLHTVLNPNSLLLDTSEQTIR